MKCHACFGLLALALTSSLAGIAAPSFAETLPKENKVENKNLFKAKGVQALLQFLPTQIVGVDITARTIHVLMPEVTEFNTESGMSLAINMLASEAVVIPLSSTAVLRQLKTDPQSASISSIGLNQIAAAVNEKQKVTMDIGKSSNGEAEVQQITIYPDQTQKTLSELVKEHFRIGTVRGVHNKFGMVRPIPNETEVTK